jgi:hypothetical protein
MAPNVEPIFLRSPFLAIATLTDQVVARVPASAVPVTLLTAGDNGALITDLWAQATGTISANRISFYLSSPAGWLYLFDGAIASVTSSANTAIAMQPITLPRILSPAVTASVDKKQGLMLPAAAVLGVGIETATAVPINIVAQGGNY